MQQSLFLQKTSSWTFNGMLAGANKNIVLNNYLGRYLMFQRTSWALLRLLPPTCGQNYKTFIFVADSNLQASLLSLLENIRLRLNDSNTDILAFNVNQEPS